MPEGGKVEKRVKKKRRRATCRVQSKTPEQSLKPPSETLSKRQKNEGCNLECGRDIPSGRHKDVRGRRNKKIAEYEQRRAAAKSRRCIKRTHIMVKNIERKKKKECGLHPSKWAAHPRLKTLLEWGGSADAYL